MPASASPARPQHVLSFEGDCELQLAQHRYHRAYLHYLIGWREKRPSGPKYAALPPGRKDEIEAEVRRLVDGSLARPAQPG